MEHIKAEDLEEDAIVEADPEQKPPSFKGRLNISSFAFQPSPKPNVKPGSMSPARRSLRIISPLSKSSQEPKSTSPLPTPKRRSSSTASLFPKKRSKSSGYAPPSTYAHLPPLTDVFAPDLICLFIGLNPGITTATTGHAYAHPSNLFWKLLHSSGCTTRRVSPSEDGDLPRLFSLGNTNIVARPTRNGSELKTSELDDSVHILEEKIRRWRPESVCIVGKSIWESVWRVKHGRRIKKEEFKYGWQVEDENMGAISEREEEKWVGARVFVACSTSGLAASLSPVEKEKIWKELGAWVEKRRSERAVAQVEQSLKAGVTR